MLDPFSLFSRGRTVTGIHCKVTIGQKELELLPVVHSTKWNPYHSRPKIHEQCMFESVFVLSGYKPELLKGSDDLGMREGCCI